MHSHVHSGKDEDRKQTLNGQLSPSYRNGQLSSSYKRENSWRQQPRELRLKHRKKRHTSQKATADRQKYAKGNVNREQHRSSDKSHGTMGRQWNKPGTRTEENRLGHNSYNRTA